MPATHPSEARQASCPREEVSAKQQLDETCSAHDRNLTVSFLGCPSNSSNITLATPGHSCYQMPSNGEGKCDEAPIAPLSDSSSSKKIDSQKSEVFWQTDQGQNNNKCSELNQDESEFHGTNTRRDGANSDESRSGGEGQVDSSSPGNSSSSEDCDESVDNSEKQVSERKRDIGSRTPDTDISSSKRSDGIKPRGPFGEALSQEEGSSRQWAKQSTSLAGCGRTLMSRMHRSPQRSPIRKKKGDLSTGSSAPGPTPAQGSFGCTNISRPLSLSPSKREETRAPAKNSGPRLSGASDAFNKTTIFRSRDDSGSADTSSDVRRSVSAKPPSPSLGASNLHRSLNSVAPTPSSAESDLRDRRRSSQHTDSPVTAADPQRIQCQLILPEEPWSSGAPHGDIQHTSPQKMLEMTRLALYEQQFKGRQQQLPESQQRRKSPHYQNRSGSLSSQAPTSIFGSSEPRTITKSISAADDIKTSLSTSCGTVSGPATAGRPRSSRRHPVLDKMFRHVLASLMMESGPPNSACLASVLDQVEGKGTTDSLRSMSRTSSSSVTNNITSRYHNSRFGGSRISGGKSNRGVESSSDDVTMSLSNALPCTLTKINEEVKNTCTIGQNEATIGLADA